MPTKATLTVAETLPKSFVLSCRTRGARPAMREKLYGIWKRHLLDPVARAIQIHYLCPARDGFPAGRRRFGAGQHRAGVELRRLRHPVRRRRVLGHLSNRLRQAGRIPDQRFEDLGTVRRGRRAARQGTGRARALPHPAQDRGVRHGGPPDLRRSDGRLARRVHGVGPQLRPGQGRAVR